MTRKPTKNKDEIDIDLKGISTLIVVLAVVYTVITNFTFIVVGGIVSALLTLIIIVIAAYYILPAIGVTALAGLITAIATLIGVTRRK